MRQGQSHSPFEEILSQKKATLSFNEVVNKEYPVGVVEPSPCMKACPAGVNVKAYVSLIATGRFQEALEVVRERNPFPGICGRVCTHPCESYCNRREVDSTVAICWLKRFVADYELQHPPEKPKPLFRTREERVAVIGSGPAGLTAANDLIRKGYPVTVFEALPKPGGMLTSGIPAFRLPRPIIETEITMIKNLGVKIKTNTKIKGKGAIDRLFDEGYKAVFIAVGAHKGKKLGVPGEDKYRGIIDGISFLREVNSGRPTKLGKKVAVIGGGNSAIDAARTTLRLGCEQVTIVYRRSRAEMPANEAEIEEAEHEGVKIHYLAAPVKLLGCNGNVVGMTCTKMKLGEPDGSGRRRPIPIEGSEFSIEVDNIIAAISQEPDLSFLPQKHDLKISKWNTFEVEDSTLATSRLGVFAGGDAVTGPNTVIDAIAAGHVAAQSIDRYLRGEPLKQDLQPERPIETEVKVDLKQQKKKKRVQMPRLAVPNRIKGFEEVELGFSEAEAIKEAQRCLRCGPCSECFLCVSECDKVVTVLTSANEEEEILLRLPPELRKIDLNSTPWQGLLRFGPKQEVPVQMTPLTCYVKEEVCRGCGDCVTVCEYSAPMLIPKGNGLYVSNINETICRGCGTCVAICPSSAIVPRYFTQDWLTDKLQTMDLTKKNVVVYTCNWYGTHLDRSVFANISVKDVNMLFIRTLCSGRLEPSFILRAFEFGAEGVLVVGCPMNECHYGFGNKHADEHFGKMQNLLSILGYSSEKFQWAWPEENQASAFVDAVDLFIRSIREGQAVGSLVKS
ncbi:MAG: NAD(P)-binding protein [bacterium]